MLSHCTHMFTVYVAPTGAQVPITSYTCTQPNVAVFLDHGQCTFSGGLRTCEIKEGAHPALLSSSPSLGLYAWDSNIPPYPNPFVVLDIPQGWYVGSVKMTFRAPTNIPTLSLSVHSAERLSTNTDRTMFSLASEAGTRPVVMNLTTLARGKYLRINMTSTGRLYLNEIEVFGTSRYTVHDTENLTFSADDRAENPHISARTISGFRADNQRIPCGTISKFYSYNDISNDPCGVFLDLLALLRTKFAFWFPPFSN